MQLSSLGFSDFKNYVEYNKAHEKNLLLRFENTIQFKFIVNDFASGITIRNNKYD